MSSSKAQTVFTYSLRISKRPPCPPVTGPKLPCNILSTGTTWTWSPSQSSNPKKYSQPQSSSTSSTAPYTTKTEWGTNTISNEWFLGAFPTFLIFDFSLHYFYFWIVLLFYWFSDLDFLMFADFKFVCKVEGFNFMSHYNDNHWNLKPKWLEFLSQFIALISYYQSLIKIYLCFILTLLNHRL